jgi:uncharacterized protein (TIGR04255 family)
MVEKQHYARPPIAEAVIELRFEGSLNTRELERVRDRFKTQYSTVEQIQTIEVMFDGAKATPKVVLDGFKMTENNAVNLLMVKPQAVGTIRLAPYENWEQLRGQAQQNWELFSHVLNTKKRVTRIGARYINRIDVPNDLFNSRKIGDLFSTHVSLGPNIARGTGTFSYAVSATHGRTGAKLTIQSAVLAQAALLEHTSITLDTDAFWDERDEIPQRIDEMWAKADMLREAKNSVFENSITDLVRDLFR